MTDAATTARRRYVRFTRWRRRRFFRVLEETANVRMAAEAAGVALPTIYRCKRLEPGFGDRMDAARAGADAALTAQGPAEIAGPRDSDALVTRRGIGGRLRVMAAGPRWWTDRHDALFLAYLRVTGNVAGSARAIGFTPKSAWNRRARVPSFARAMDEAMEEAEVRLEYRLLEHAAHGTDAMAPGAAEVNEEEVGRFDPWQAMWQLKMRQSLREGRRHSPRGQPPPIEEVTSRILRNIDAIERYRERFGEAAFARRE